jgi:hypothetical protein
MSSNKGKDGEMKAIRLATYIAESEEGVDLIRHTTTNTADMGADMILTHHDDLLPKMKQIAEGEPSSERVESTSMKSARSRFDVKTTNNKLQKDTVKKFVSDTRKHPDCQGHILMGGKDMTGPARKEFHQAQEAFSENGKTLMYINNDGFKGLYEHYRGLIENSGGCEQNELPESEQK